MGGLTPEQEKARCAKEALENMTPEQRKAYEDAMEQARPADAEARRAPARHARASPAPRAPPDAPRRPHRGCRRDARTPLVLYSPHGRDLLGLVEKEFERAHPDVDVRWLDMGSQEVYDRLRSEKANPQADVWYGGPDTIFARGAGEGLLAPTGRRGRTPSRPTSRRDGDLYFGLYRTPAMPVYNSKASPPRRRRASGTTCSTRSGRARS